MPLKDKDNSANSRIVSREADVSVGSTKEEGPFYVNTFYLEGGLCHVNI